MRRLLTIIAIIAAGAIAVQGYRWHQGLVPPWLRPSPLALTEAAARGRFLREHPGEKPLNHQIGGAAVALYKTKPMGKFVLGLGYPDNGNDCSDFVACAIDEGLGVKARFKRHSRRHLVAQDWRYFESFNWDRSTPLLEGDTLAVAHSPWYAPYPGACWHVGIIGSDGMVYDFVKLKRWAGPRYGRHCVDWFVRHATGRDQIVIGRLRPLYRYRLADIDPPNEN